MESGKVFKRWEIKYLLTKEQKESLHIAMKDHMEEDAFGASTIRNIYYDTPDKLLIRRSLDKPKYKEKLRVRAYEQAKGDSKVFIEIKKKYKKIVYKRRMSLEEKTVKAYLAGDHRISEESQISKEIDYFTKYYGNLEPAIFLSYDREAFFSKTDPNFRMTFDENIVTRDYDISLTSPVYGEPDMLDGEVILEVKTALGIPKWLLDFFSENNIYKISFSKYGNAYKMALSKKLEKEEKINKVQAYGSSKNTKDNPRDLGKIKRRVALGRVKKLLPLVACLMIYIATFTNWTFQTAMPYNQVYVDVNPSIHFLTNRREEVIDLKADSLEGEGIIEGIQYKGKTVEEVTEEILGKMVNDKYISKDKEYLLLTVDGKDSKKADKEKYYLDNLIHKYLNKKEIKPIILKQQLNNSKKIEELAVEYNTSISKMTFIDNIIGLDKELEASELVDLSISELVDLMAKNKLDISSIVDKDINFTASESDLVNIVDQEPTEPELEETLTDAGKDINIKDQKRLASKEASQKDKSVKASNGEYRSTNRQEDTNYSSQSYESNQVSGSAYGDTSYNEGYARDPEEDDYDEDDNGYDDEADYEEDKDEDEDDDDDD